MSKEEIYRQYGFEHIEDEIQSLGFAQANGLLIEAWMDGAFTALVKAQQKAHSNKWVVERLYKIADLIAGTIPMDPKLAGQFKQIFKPDD